MTNISVILPVAPYHIHKLPRALQSVRAQTIPCTPIVIYDDEKRGAGYARNEGLRQASGDFVIFLDSDDELLPTFAEQCLAAYQRTGRYIYCDYLDNRGARHDAPDCAWTDGTFHLVTTLLPLDWARRFAFDETLAANEDADYYIRLNIAGLCGLRLVEPLVVYHHFEGERSEAAKPYREQYQQLLKQRYGGKTMGCCNDAPPANQAVMGERALVRPRWGLGTASKVGAISGIRYPRVDSSDTLEIDKRDLLAQPHLWEAVNVPKATVVSAAPPSKAQSSGFSDVVNALLGLWTPPVVTPPAPVLPPPPAAVVAVKPDVARVVKFGAPTVKKNADPVFVFPEKDYPSYTDVRRLVELSGFNSLKMGFDVWGNPSKLIFLSPEHPYIETLAKYHLDAIWWNLEYGGEYEPSEDDLALWRDYGGEVWASDPAWAKAHDAKMVVMGSHPDLFSEEKGHVYLHESPHLLTMLGYMTPRRQLLKDSLSDLEWPDEIYPGYGFNRDMQLLTSRLMLHAHQDDARRAIAPQRFALCAAYHLPLIHESVPDEGAYAGSALFAPYDLLAETTRAALADSALQARGDALYEWLCEDMTFRKSVEAALKS